MLDKEAKFITFVRENSEIGYGNMMSQISRIWHEKDPIGAFTTGPCYAQVEAYGSYFKLVDEVRQLREERDAWKEAAKREFVETYMDSVQLCGKLREALEWYRAEGSHGRTDFGHKAHIILSEIKGQGDETND